MPVYLPVKPGIETSAVFGGARKQYRYRLERKWDAQGATILFVMMNPSVADLAQDDRTVRRAIDFALRWGFGRLLVGNVFAYRATDQKELLTPRDPVGPDNDEHLLAMAAEAKQIVFAYGKPHASLRGRGMEVARLFREAGHRLHVLELSQDGTPKHPLYLKGDLTPAVWAPAVRPTAPSARV